MNICQYNVVLDCAGRNALVMDSVAEYPYLDRLDSPGRIARLMREVFQLHLRAEEYLYLICADTKCCCCPFMLPYNYSGCMSQN